MTAIVSTGGGGITIDYQEQFCTRCVLSASFPGISFAAGGECSYCLDAAERLVIDSNLIAEATAQGKADAAAVGADYHALALYSGGKDSSLALSIAVRAGLRVLAFTLDNGYLSREASDNMANVLNALEVDHIRFRPPGTLMRALYRESLALDFGPDTIKYSTGGCGSCISLVLAAASRTAHAHRIPLLIGGWSPGQFSTSPVVDSSFLGAVIRRQLEPVAKVAPGLGDYLARWLPDGGERPLVLINPLYTAEYSEESAIDQLAQLGWSRPNDTDSCSTNCRLNGLLIVDHVRRFGFHPYAYELAHHVRVGAMTRSAALDKITAIGVAADALQRVATDLGVPTLWDGHRP